MATRRTGNINLDLESLDIDVSVKLRDGSVENFNVRDQLEIERSDINGGYLDQPGKYAWWGMVYEVSKTSVEKAKIALDEAEAEADMLIRREIIMDGGKITEVAVTRQLKAHPVYKKAAMALIEAQRASGILGRVCKAFEQRMDALVSLGANLRKEDDNAELTMRKAQAKRVTQSK